MCIRDRPLVVSDYRNRKILKRYRVTPIGPLMILMVQVVIYTIYSLVSLISVYAVASIFFGFHPSGSLLIFFIAYLLVMIAMFSIGMMVGGLSPNAKAAGVYASILYFPMLIFSGATLPYEIMPQTLRNFADILPLTQGIKLLKAAVLGIPADNFFLPVISMSAISCVCIFAAVKFFRWE